MLTFDPGLVDEIQQARKIVDPGYNVDAAPPFPFIGDWNGKWIDGEENRSVRWTANPNGSFIGAVQGNDQELDALIVGHLSNDGVLQAVFQYPGCLACAVSGAIRLPAMA